MYNWSKGLIIIFAAIIPFASGFLKTEITRLSFLIAILGIITAILTGLSILLKIQKNGLNIEQHQKQ